jgi:prepilin-type N-terminal cleavage/methylation domain-containing protein
MNGLHHWLRGSSGEGGFTLAEILVACAIISVGLLAVATGFGVGVDGVEAGRQQSTAVFLAEQQIERAKALGMRQTGLVQLVIGTDLPAAEAYGSIPNAPPSYRRTTAITPAVAGGFNGKQVDVVVFYRPVTGRGVLTTERSVSLSIYLASR